MSPILGLQTPQAMTTCSASIVALVGVHAADPAVDHVQVGDLDVRHDGQGAGGQGAARA